MADPIRKLSSDQVAFVSDLTAIQDDMRHFCVSILVGDQGVEDVLQEANRVILEKADEFEIGTNFKAWAFSIIRFQAMAYCKRNQRESRMMFNSELVQVLLDKAIETDHRQVETVNALKSCISKLRDQERRVLEGRYWSEKSLEEFAEEIGRTVDSLKGSLVRIRKQLRVCLEKKQIREPIQ